MKPKSDKAPGKSAEKSEAETPANDPECGPAPTASEIIAAARAILGSKPFPKQWVTFESQASRSNRKIVRKSYRNDFEVEMLLWEASELWFEAERIARILRKEGKEAASTLGYEKPKMEGKKLARRISASELLRIATGDANSTRARRKMEEYFVLRFKETDPKKRVEQWLREWGQTPSDHPGLQHQIEHLKCFFESRRSATNSENALKRGSRKKEREIEKTS